MHFDSALHNMATDKELVQLGQSEHPILRSAAFREMLRRKSVNHFDILMGHLDDTAIVMTDAGEFGIWNRMVSDDILLEAKWKAKEDQNKSIEEVLTKHNYLRSAYLILLKIDPQEKYYPFIKTMAMRPRNLDPDGYELTFGDIEFALYGLAKFKKKEDVKIIKEKLMKNIWRLSDISFRLMKEFPDTAYLDVFQTYHRRRFYRFSGDGNGGFTGSDVNRASSRDFIEALVMQQNEQSATILDTIVQRLPRYEYVAGKTDVEGDIVDAVWEHPCPAYTKLREKIKRKAILRQQHSIPVERFEIPIDTTDENYRWWP